MSEPCSWDVAVWDYFLVPVIGIIIFVLLTVPPFNDWLTTAVSPSYILTCQLLILFVVLFFGVRWHNLEPRHCWG